MTGSGIPATWNSKKGRILAYSKKNRTARMRYIDYGLGVFRAEAFAGSWMPTDLADVYADLLKKGELTCCGSAASAFTKSVRRQD
jgi:hypothetical protein